MSGSLDLGMRSVLTVCVMWLFLLWLPSVAAGQERQAEPDVEVVFVGANHNFTFLHPEFSPAHIRALLDQIDPAAVCLEILPDWDGSAGIPTYPQEQYAALTWAERAGVPVHAVDWNPSRQALPPVVRMSDTVPPFEHDERFERFRQSYLSTVQWTAARAFGETDDDLESVQRTLGSNSTTWAERDDSIAARIREAAIRYPGRRVAVVYGRGHYLPLKHRLESRFGVRASSAEGYFPIAADGIRRGWHPDDAIVLLGTNLDDWRSIAFPQSRNHQRTKELLDRLRGERPESVVTRYYEARWAMLFADMGAASVLLEGIIEEAGTTEVPYQANERWSWPPFRTFEDKARFQLAVTHDLTGDHEAAARRYEALLTLPEDRLVVPVFMETRRVDLRPYLESLIRTPYRGGVEEAYRAYLALGR